MRTATAVRLSGIAEAQGLAARGDYRGALARSQHSLAWDAQQMHGDPFARGALHLLRAAWFEALGDREGVARELRWSENLDIVGWPGGEPQAAEIDWMLSVHASHRRGLSALLSGDTAAGCAQLARVLRFWNEPDPGYQPLLENVRRQHDGRCGS